MDISSLWSCCLCCSDRHLRCSGYELSEHVCRVDRSITSQNHPNIAASTREEQEAPPSDSPDFDEFIRAQIRNTKFLFRLKRFLQYSTIRHLPPRSLNYDCRRSSLCCFLFDLQSVLPPLPRAIARLNTCGGTPPKALGLPFPP